MSIKVLLDDAILNTRRNLRFLLDEGKLSISALASLMRMSKAFVSRWLSGESTPSLKAVIAVCQIFDVTMDEFCLTDMTREPDDNFMFDDMVAETNDEALVLAMFRSATEFDKETVIRTLQSMCSAPRSTYDLTQSVLPDMGAVEDADDGMCDD